MELYTIRKVGEPLGTIAIVARDHVNTGTVTSLLGNDFTWLPAGQVIDQVIIQGSILTSQRNEAVQRMRGEWLLFIDDDMVWKSDAIGRLVARREQFDLDMVSGLCFRRGEPFQPTMYMRETPTSGGYNFREVWDEDEVVEVDATGCAFLLIHKRVFEMIAGGPMPPYDYRTREGGPPPRYFRWDGTAGEDIRFCEDAKTAGARVWVDTSIPIGHVAEKVIDHRDFLTQLAFRDPEVEAFKRKINDDMGLPTMSAAEAREKLGW
jgi:hypothetical protein